MGTSRVLTRVDVSPNLQVRDLGNALKRAARLTGQDLETTALFHFAAMGPPHAGLDGLAVKYFGQWRSDAVEPYTRISGQLSTRMAPAMIQKPALQQNEGATPTPHPGEDGTTTPILSLCRDGHAPNSERRRLKWILSSEYVKIAFESKCHS
ncbi:hypothetical protein PHMEG_00012960 [Phytophthora megakarya]|uniref:Uncharacterized protein n=1 Tax=Phytophthora megakarya TaxID=4795 RepID=A0A225W7X5_9STRA|nr:hypothetical protein PHMEG_00012960 [Phytophthora megakarya]